MKIYSPLSIDTDKDEPSFTNDEGTKWWLVALGSTMDSVPNNKEDGALYRVKNKQGEESYLVVHNGEIIKETENIESGWAKLDQNYLVRSKA
jgi:hypothetical protein